MRQSSVEIVSLVAERKEGRKQGQDWDEGNRIRIQVRSC